METKREVEELNADPNVRDTGVTCRIPSCGGHIVADLGYPPYEGERRIGPGQPQSQIVKGLRCNMCQISYAHIPGPEGPNYEALDKINRDLRGERDKERFPDSDKIARELGRFPVNLPPPTKPKRR